MDQTTELRHTPCMDIYVYSGAYHRLGLICVFVIIDDLNVDRCLRYMYIRRQCKRLGARAR